MLDLEFEGTGSFHSGIAEDCNIAGFPNLALRLEFMFGFYSEVVSTLRDKCSQYFEQQERNFESNRNKKSC